MRNHTYILPFYKTIGKSIKGGDFQSHPRWTEDELWGEDLRPFKTPGQDWALSVEGARGGADSENGPSSKPELVFGI